MLLANTAQIRLADEIQIHEKKVPGIILMEEAGRLSAEAILSDYPDQQSFLIAVGPGNNGGDGLVIGRHLYLKDKEVQLFLSNSPDRFAGDALINYKIIAEMPVPIVHFGEEEIESVVHSFEEKPLLIDALLGTGIQSVLREPVSEMLTSLKKQQLRCVAVDLPSGLGAHTGELINDALQAERTYTFQMPKICHVIQPAAERCGEIRVLDIGIWPEVVEQLGIRRVWMDKSWAGKQVLPRKINSHKGSFGHALLAGGSRDMPGAICLSTFAAQKTGAGLTTVICPESCRQTIMNHCPEAMCKSLASDFLQMTDMAFWDKNLKNKQAVLMGPGMGQSEESVDFLRAVLPTIQVPLVLDADALNILANHDDLWALLPDSTILTPHPGEMRRLTGLEKVQSRRLEVAERLAQDKAVYVVLKGAGTIIACPDGQTFVNSNGNPGMATAGSGDVLAGIICSLLVQGYEVAIAAALGVYLHGKAGDDAAQHIGMHGMTAMDIARHISVDKL